jgi:eukaryotic-like serine/threonine-protein kinase
MGVQTKAPNALPQQPKPAATRRIGRYLLLDQIGAGGTGVVHRARDDISGNTVALKQLHAPKAKPAQQRQLEALFELEYHTLVRLKHPRIIEVYDYGLCDEGPYYTMELLDGSDLHSLAPLPYRQACRYLRDVASSLALLHARRLVHRDVTVRNVRLTADGRAKLIDFGGSRRLECPRCWSARRPASRPKACASCRSTNAPICFRSVWSHIGR